MKLEVWLVSHFRLYMLELVRHPFIYPLEVLYVYLCDITHPWRGSQQCCLIRKYIHILIDNPSRIRP